MHGGSPGRGRTGSEAGLGAHRGAGDLGIESTYMKLGAAVMPKTPKSKALCYTLDLSIKLLSGCVSFLASKAL